MKLRRLPVVLFVERLRKRKIIFNKKQNIILSKKYALLPILAHQTPLVLLLE